MFPESTNATPVFNSTAMPPPLCAPNAAAAAAAEVTAHAGPRAYGSGTLQLVITALRYAIVSFCAREGLGQKGKFDLVSHATDHSHGKSDIETFFPTGRWGPLSGSGRGARLPGLRLPLERLASLDRRLPRRHRPRPHQA